MSVIKAKEVKSLAEGRWLEILTGLAPALEGACARPGKHTPSPLRGGRDGFRLFHDAALNGRGVDNQEGVFSDGFALLQWVTGQDFYSVLKEVHQFLSGADFKSAPLPKIEKKPQGDVKKLTSLWGKGVAGDFNHPAVKYFEGRCIPSKIALNQSEIRTVKGLMTKEDEKLVCYPGFISRVTDRNGEMVTLHRTFLSESGQKAPIKAPKKLMPVAPGKSYAGASIKLGGSAVDGYLAIAEGVETALSVITATGIPCWSVVSTFGMETFVPPRYVKTLVIFGDKDVSRGGQEAAKALKASLEKKGIRVLRVFPKNKIPKEKKGVDWNDVLINSNGIFPSFEQIKAV